MDTSTRTMPVIARPEKIGDVELGTKETWVMGNSKDGRAAFRLDQGAGLGNSHLTLLVEFEDGSTVTEFIDVAGLTELWVNSIVDEQYEDEVQKCRDCGELTEDGESRDRLCLDCYDLAEHGEEPILEHTDRTQDANIDAWEEGK